MNPQHHSMNNRAACPACGDIEGCHVPARLNRAIAESPDQCPGGDGCMCCNAGCDCGCRNQCPRFAAWVLDQLPPAGRVAPRHHTGRPGRLLRARALLQACPIPLRPELRSLIPELASRQRMLRKALGDIDGWPASGPFLTPQELLVFATPLSGYVCRVTRPGLKAAFSQIVGILQVAQGAVVVDHIVVPFEQVIDLQCIDSRVAKKQRDGATRHPREEFDQTVM